LFSDLFSFGDFNGDGSLDILQRTDSSLKYYKNNTIVPTNSIFRIEVLGPSGERNQQGRVVKIYPQNHPGVIMTRVVESGSGFLSQGPYDFLVAAMYKEPHYVEVYYQDRVVNFIINPGEKKRIYPDGSTSNY
jgi:hypothetical protein